MCTFQGGAGDGSEMYDEESALCEKKKSKIKISLSPKKIKQQLVKKDKDKDKNKDKKLKKVDISPKHAVSESKSSKGNPESEEWKAFQAMQDRINQMVKKTSERVSELETGFEDELSKLNAESVQSSPWATIGGTSVTSIDVKSAVVKESPSTEVLSQTKPSWIGFDDNFDAAEETDEVQETQVEAVKNTESQVGSEEVTEATENDVQPGDRFVEDLTKQVGDSENLSHANLPDDENLAAVVGEKSELQETTLVEDPFDLRIVVQTLKESSAVDDEFCVHVGNMGADIFGDAGDVVSPTDDFNPRANFDIEKLKVQPMQDGIKKSRPRPRPQTAAKSANPFKIALLATNTDSAEDDVEDDENDEEMPTTSFNPFCRGKQGDEMGVGGFNPFTRNLEQGVGSVYDPFQVVQGSSTSAVSYVDIDADDEPKGNPFAKEIPLEEEFAGGQPMVKAAEPSSPGGSSSRSSEEEPQEENPEPLPPFHPKEEEKGWNFFLRYPFKKKLTQNRVWKPVFVKVVINKDVPLLKVFTNNQEKECIHELSLNPSYDLCEMELQQFDQYGKCHTVKVQHIVYKEKVGVKGDRITPTIKDLSKVRDFKGLKDLMHKPKATMILDHAPIATESLKFASMNYAEYKHFVHMIEDFLFYQKISRVPKSQTYSKDEIIVDVLDEYYADIDSGGHITYHKARVRLFCVAFLTGNPVAEVGINDRRRKGKEIVGRHDIIPIKTEDWIRFEDQELHSSIDPVEFEKTKLLKFSPLDGSHFELMRFRVRPRANLELPLQIGIQMSVIDRHVEIRADVLIPGYYSTSKRASQTPCEDIQIRFPIPEPWVYLFRVEKHFKYGSVHSAKRKPGKIKGLERLTMFAQGVLPPSLMQVSNGIAKYEHVFHAIVWRMSRLPERNEG